MSTVKLDSTHQWLVESCLSFRVYRQLTLETISRSQSRLSQWFREDRGAAFLFQCRSLTVWRELVSSLTPEGWRLSVIVALPEMQPVICVLIVKFKKARSKPTSHLLTMRILPVRNDSYNMCTTVGSNLFSCYNLSSVIVFSNRE